MKRFRILLLFWLALVTAPASASAALTFTADFGQDGAMETSWQMQLGQEIPVDICVSNVPSPGLISIGFLLEFDPSILEAVQSATVVYPNWPYGASVSFDPPGRITIKGFKLQPGLAGNSVRLATVTFKGLGRATSELRIKRLTPGDWFVLQNGTVLDGDLGAGSSLATMQVQKTTLHDEFILDYGMTYGLWHWTQAGGWKQLNDADPGQMVAVDVDNDGAEELVVSFPGYGLYYDDGTGAWPKINDLIPENIIRLNNGIACDFGAAYGLWYWSQAGGWKQWNTANPDNLLAVDIDNDGTDDLVASFAGYGLYYDDGTGAWPKITDLIPENIIRLNNGIACDFGATYGLWVWSQAGDWVQRNTVDPGQMVAVDIDNDAVEELVVSFSGYGLYYFDETNGWQLLNSAIPENMKPINFYP